MDRFAEILFELGDLIGVELYPDQNQICQINFDKQLHIQIQHDSSKESLLISSFLCEVPPGKYREKLFKSALISNGEYPRIGTLAYSERNNQLTLFEYLPLPELRANKLFDFLNLFIDKAQEWKKAIEGGHPLPVVEGERSSNDSIFGIKP